MLLRPRLARHLIAAHCADGWLGAPHCSARAALLALLRPAAPPPGCAGAPAQHAQQEGRGLHQRPGRRRRRRCLLPRAIFTNQTLACLCVCVCRDGGPQCFHAHAGAAGVWCVLDGRQPGHGRGALQAGRDAGARHAGAPRRVRALPAQGEGGGRGPTRGLLRPEVPAPPAEAQARATALFAPPQQPPACCACALREGGSVPASPCTSKRGASVVRRARCLCLVAAAAGPSRRGHQ